VKAYRALGRFRAGAPFRPWLLQIVGNEARNRRRSAGRREQLVLRAAAGAAPGDAAPSPEAALLSAERRGALLAAVNRLSEERRLAVACRYFLDLSEEEMAAALGCRRNREVAALARARAAARRAGGGGVNELERELRTLGAAIEFPPQPDLVRAVRGRLRVPRRRPWLRPLAVALATLVLALGVAMAVPEARSAILRFLGLRGVRIELVDELPEVRVTRALDLGDRMSRELVTYRVLTSSLLGKPDAVYIRGGQVSFLYGTPMRVRLLLTQFPGSTRPELFKKVAGPETRVEAVTVNGRPGIWLSGAPHFLHYAPTGGVLSERVRLARNTLLWERGELTLRLGGGLTKEQALRIARSVR